MSDVRHAHGVAMQHVQVLSGLRRESGVEQEDASRMLDDERRDHDAFAGEVIGVRGHRVMPGVDGLDARMSHLARD